MPDPQRGNILAETLYLAEMSRAALEDTATLTLSSPLVLASRSGEGQQWQADMASLGQGRYAIAWTLPGNTQIAVSTVASASASPVELTTLTAENGSLLESSYGQTQNMILEPRPDGRLSLSWTEWPYKIKGVLIDPLSGQTTAPANWSAGVGYGYSWQDKKVVPLASGKMVAAWAENSSLETLNGLYLVRVNEQGVQDAAPYQLTFSTPTKYMLASAPDGGLWVLWTETQGEYGASVNTTWLRHFPDPHNFNQSSVQVLGTDVDTVRDFAVDGEGHLYLLSGGEVVRFAGQALPGGQEAPEGPVLLRGTETSDQLSGTPQADIIQALGGNDVLTGLVGDDQLDGGNGMDAAVYTGHAADYSFLHNQDGSLTVVDAVPGRDGTDTLNRIEQLIFTDKVIQVANTVVSQRYSEENELLRLGILR